MAKTTTSFALSEDTKKLLKEIAEKHDRSQAWVIEKLVLLQSKSSKKLE